MAKSQMSYHQMLRAEMSTIVDSLELPELYKQSMKARWLDQVIWTDQKASQSQKRYYALRLTTVIGGVIIPALVAFNNFGLESAGEQYVRSIFPLALFGFTQVVAVCTAIEEFFQYGVRWRQYRTTAESLKSEGWQYFQISGAYRKAGSHLQAYPVFSTRVERIIRRDVQTYLSEIAKEQQREDDDSNDKMPSSPHPLSPLSSGFFAGVSASTEIEPLEPNDPDAIAIDPHLEGLRDSYRRPPMPPPNPQVPPDRRKPRP
ncbi:DUF4231 domain-containing protein [Leptolyngbya sp. PCC 6406]|uniref:DUF4231 domain-containing protein n=1 Tax=Leptolyngbya sp. PCC 6406 TaxID=1173264 RepID=UPI0002AC88BD|nr:DUF4231 domain-containing protein [Leptolyngbya sp. PCC 6406]